MQQSENPRMRYHGNGIWVVESQSHRGVGHLVNPASGRCTCPAGKHGRTCWHLRTARAAEAWRTAPTSPRPAGMAALQEAFGA